MRKARVLLVSLLLLTTQTIATAQTVSEVPFSFLKGFVIVEAKIKGNTPVHVILATGTENSLTDPSLMKKYDLSAGVGAEGPITGRNDKTYAFAIVRDVSVGDSKPKNVNMRFGSLGNVSTLVGHEIFALLGSDFFRDQVVQFDFKNKVVRLLDKLPPELTDTKNPNFNSSKTTVLRMAPKPSNPFQATLLIPIVEDAQINGKKAKLLLDTGVAASVVVSSSTAKKLGLTLAAESGPPREDKVTLLLDSSELKDVPVLIYAKFTDADRALSISNDRIVAGSLFLQAFVATFDYKKSVVVLERF